MSKNKFYSILSLNTIIEKDLISDKDKILKYFSILEETNTSKAQTDLITLKKGLYLIKISETENGQNLLKKLIDKNSNLKTIAQEIFENKLMKLFNLLVILFFLISCSFDNKSGIWKNEGQISKKEIKKFNDFKSISLTQEKFNKIVIKNNNYKFIKSNAKVNFDWKDIYFSRGNNSKNFKYDNNNQLIFKK